jgi:hypothetical protein
MKTNLILRLPLYISMIGLVSLVTISNSRAAFFDETFTNDFMMDEFYLWIEPEENSVVFSDWPLVPNGWKMQLLDQAYLHGYFNHDQFLYPYRGRWQISFYDNRDQTDWISDFSMPWAELFDGEIIGTGYLDYNASARQWSHRIEPIEIPLMTEVPLPGSALLLAPALILMIGYRIRNRILV